MTADVGLSVAEVAELLLLQAQVAKVCGAAASRELAAQRPELAARLDRAEAELQAQQARMVPHNDALVPLEADLADVRRQIAEQRAVGDGDPLSARLAAKRDLVVLAGEEAELGARVHLIMDMMSPVIADITAAKYGVERAQVALDAFDAAISAPLLSSAGLATEAGRTYLLRSGAWASHLDEPKTIMGVASHNFIMQALRESGVGEMIERNIVDGQKRQQAGKDGVSVGDDPRFAYSSARACDGSGGQPERAQYSRASADLEAQQMRWLLGGWQSSPGVYRADVQDISGSPADLAGNS